MDIFYLESAYPDYIEYQAHGEGGGSWLISKGEASQGGIATREW